MTRDAGGHNSMTAVAYHPTSVAVPCPVPETAEDSS